MVQNSLQGGNINVKSKLTTFKFIKNLLYQKLVIQSNSLLNK